MDFESEVQGAISLLEKLEDGRFYRKGTFNICDNWNIDLISGLRSVLQCSKADGGSPYSRRESARIELGLNMKSRRVGLDVGCDAIRVILAPQTVPLLVGVSRPNM
jgi:hypothetical protein